MTEIDTRHSIVPKHRVFITMGTDRLDLSSLYKWGTVEVLWNKQVYPDNVDNDLPGLMTLMRSKLHSFNADHDYLALVGDPLAIVAAGFILGTTQRRIRCLKWDNEEHCYYACTFHSHD